MATAVWAVSLTALAAGYATALPLVVSGVNPSMSSTRLESTSNHTSSMEMTVKAVVGAEAAAAAGKMTPPVMDSFAVGFVILMVWRYLRQVVHLVSFWAYRPAEPVANPRYTSEDVTVIVPTIDPQNDHFLACLISICRNRPSVVLVVTAGEELRERTQAVLDTIPDRLRALGMAGPVPPVRLLVAGEANKRRQVLCGFDETTTAVVVPVDDHVVWPQRFLHFALAAFEDPRVGFVGTNKRVVHEGRRGLGVRILNMIQCLYLERHNFEIRASNAVDGGVFVVSGRTSLIRTDIVRDMAFRHSYINDYFCFRRVGPLTVDDDNFLTRWCVAHGVRIKIQYRPETLVVTSLGSYAKFVGGLQRWARTTWRSNTTSLAHAHVWRSQPWSVYAVQMSLLTNFALFYDTALFVTLYYSGFVQHRTPAGHNDSPHHRRTTAAAMLALAAWILSFKMVKPFAYFWRHPRDLVLLPFYFLFTWLHSLIKLYALLTITNIGWSGRNLKAINTNIQPEQPTSPSGIPLQPLQAPPLPLRTA